MRNKLYYPASHIVTGLYTSGKEWMLQDGTEYIGYYHKYVDGTVLTVATYSEFNSKTLIPYMDLIAQPDNHEYNSAIKKVNVYTAPIYKYPLPTIEDYNKGFFQRYFVRRRNYSTYVDIMEIDSKQFNTLNTPGTGIDGNLYIGTTINWKLTGPLKDVNTNSGTIHGVEDTNRRLVEIKDKDLKGLINFLTDYTELTIYSKSISNDIKKMFGN